MSEAEKIVDQIRDLLGVYHDGGRADAIALVESMTIPVADGSRETRERFKRRTDPMVPAIVAVIQERWVTPWTEV